MLIVLDPSLSSYAVQGEIPQSVITGLDMISLGFREGRHILAGSPRTLNALIALPQLQPLTKSALRTARDRFSELMGLPGKFSTFVSVFPHDFGSIRRVIQSQKTILEVPISHFSHSGKVQDTILLTEHLDDAAIAAMMARFYRANASLGHLPIVCEPRGGGGSNLGVTITQLAAAERFCVTLVDNDKKSPSGAVGDTLKSVRRHYNDTGPSPLIELCVLECKEMENALPDYFYEEAYGADPNHRESCVFLRSLSNGGAQDARDFVDIKEGLSLAGILSLPAPTPDFQFWNSQLGLLTRATPLAVQHDPNCLVFQTCQNTQACCCWFLKPNNANILRHASSAMTRWRRDQWANLNGPRKDIWLKTGRVVFEWSSGWTFSAA
jgi:hypothetical protein